MAFDEQELEAALSALLVDLEGETDDAQDIYLRLRQLLDGIRAMGMPLPDDLVRLEHDLGAEFEAEAGGPVPDGYNTKEQ